VSDISMGGRGKQSAQDVLSSGFSIRAAAQTHGVPHASHVQYWVAKWRGSLVDDVVKESEGRKETTSFVGTSTMSAGFSSSSSSQVIHEILGMP
ncbi:MAG: hypothetical protein SGPRY_004188, partial [Prymnesium sp.]